VNSVAEGVERPYLTYREAEQYTGVERTTLYRAMKRGKLRASGYGSRVVRFHRDELDRWMQSREQ
jgi:excisionase family DNA binding protein